MLALNSGKKFEKQTNSCSNIGYKSEDTDEVVFISEFKQTRVKVKQKCDNKTSSKEYKDRLAALEAALSKSSKKSGFWGALCVTWSLVYQTGNYFFIKFITNLVYRLYF